MSDFHLFVLVVVACYAHFLESHGERQGRTRDAVEGVLAVQDCVANTLPPAFLFAIQIRFGAVMAAVAQAGHLFSKVFVIFRLHFLQAHHGWQGALQKRENFGAPALPFSQRFRAVFVPVEHAVAIGQNVPLKNGEGAARGSRSGECVCVCVCVRA